MPIGYLTHPDCAALVDPLSVSGKRVKEKYEAQTLFTRSEERVAHEVSRGE
jgi:hypothetical protein